MLFGSDKAESEGVTGKGELGGEGDQLRASEFRTDNRRGHQKLRISLPKAHSALCPVRSTQQDTVSVWASST